MKLSDIMSAAGLQVYAEIALVIFFVSFVLIAVHALIIGKTEGFEQVSRLPLEEPGDAKKPLSYRAPGAASRTATAGRTATVRRNA